MSVTLRLSKIHLCQNNSLIKQFEKKITEIRKCFFFPGHLLNTASVRGITGDINVDDGARVYNLDARMTTTTTKDLISYVPTFKVGLQYDRKNVT